MDESTSFDHWKFSKFIALEWNSLWFLVFILLVFTRKIIFVLGFLINRQSMFDSLENDLVRNGDVHEIRPDFYSGQYRLIDSVSTTTIESSSSISLNTTNPTVIDPFDQKDLITRVQIIESTDDFARSRFVRWLNERRKNFTRRTFLFSSLIALCLILFLIFVIFRLNCAHRFPTRKNSQINGKHSVQLQQRYSLVPSDGRNSKKRVPKLLRYLHTNEEKPNTFRLSQNSKKESYQLISTLQDSRSMAYRNSDCLLNEHCCIHSSFSQPVSSPPSVYHQVNRLMLSGSEPPLPLASLRHAQVAPTPSNTLRSIKKDFDNSTAQTYSAVYSCDLASNLDIDPDHPQKTYPGKRRSILKNPHSSSSSIRTKILFLYVKNLVDCYSIQMKSRNNSQPMLLAIADDNRIQLFQAFVS